MATDQWHITVLDPTVISTTIVADMAPRPKTLDGKVIGLLANGKRNADNLLDKISELIGEYYRCAGFIKFNKRDASRPCSANLLQEWLQHCDVVITATGD